MSKKRDHIFDNADIARSVILGHEVAALCGLKAVLTRERLEERNYYTVCKRCMAAAAKATGDDAAMRLYGKGGWLETVERAWKTLYENSHHQTVSSSWMTDATGAIYTYKVRPWDTI
jgi:hypothetical protein